MTSITEKEILAYLLGKLTDDFDKDWDFTVRCFSSDENTELFEMVRDDLIEIYLRGHLPEKEKLLFESYFLRDTFNLELFNFSKMLRDHLRKIF